MSFLCDGLNMKYDKQKLEKMLEFATGKQVEKIEAFIELKSKVKVAERLGCCESSVRKALSAVEHKMSKAGFGSHFIADSHIPEGFAVKGTSTMYKDGEPVIQWVKTNTELQDQYQDMIEACTDILSGQVTRLEPTPVPAYINDDLICDYTIGDAHVGMYAWARETGIDWDLQKGVDIMRRGMNHLVASAPPAGTAFILDVGDYFHADNSNNETARSGHKLDVDGRYSKVMKEGIQAIVDLIDMALSKHKKVIYRSVIGNHNDHSAQMLNIAIGLRYENEPRVEVMDSPSMFNYYKFGVNLLADTHGHTIKPDKLPITMATDVPELWAQTTERVWRTGHVHHESVKEYSGCKVITYRTLAPKDSWHNESGYRSNRDMRCTIYHKDTGKVSMNVVNPSMLGY